MATQNKDFLIKNGLTIQAGSNNSLTFPTTRGANNQVLAVANSATGELTWDDVSEQLSVLSTKTLDNPNAYSTSVGDYFGYAVAISGNYAIVGAYLEDDAGGNSSGKAYIYDVTTGSLIHTLDNPNAAATSAGDQFGYAVAISGNYAIVGARWEDDAGGTNSGKAYIYNVTTGTLLHTLDNPNPYGTSVDDYFGASVAISGYYAIVGAWQEDELNATSSGKAYIYDVTTGSLIHTLDNPNAVNLPGNDYFGYAVAISNNYAIVGAYLEDAASDNFSGKAYIFDVTTGSLIHTLDNPNAYGTSSSDNFGRSVAISGNYAIVGAMLEDDAGGSGSGKAYIYDISTFATSTISSANYVLDNPNAYDTSDGDNFGYAVSISGNYAIVGAWQEDDAGGAGTNAQSGKAYIYDITTFATSTISSANYVLDNPNAYNTSTFDYFGQAVAISGNYAIVGAYREDDAGGSDSGKAYTFKTNGLPYTYAPQEITSFAPSGGISSIGDLSDVDLSTAPTDGQILHWDNANGVFVPTDKAAPETNTTLTADSVNQKLVYTDENGTSNDIDLSWAVDDTNLARITSGTVDANTGIATFTRDDTTTFTVNFSALFDDTNLSRINSASFDTSNGELTLTRDDNGTAATVNLDGRYLTSNTELELASTTTLNNPNAYGTGVWDFFGYSVAVSGDHAIVGVPDEDDAGGTSSGKAYIYNVTTGSLLHTLNNPNPFGTSQEDEFGWSVAIDGNYAIVGAYYEDDGALQQGTWSGKAYIYNVTTGSLLHTLDNPNPYSISNADNFGNSVAISGNYAIVSAWQEDDAGGSESGKAYIFDVTTGSLVYTLNNPNAYGTSASDTFGVSVSISGNYAIVGARGEDDASGTTSGKAYIYDISTFASSTISSATYVLDNPNPYSTSTSDRFGESVAVSGNYAIISAPFEDDAAGTDSGKAYIYDVTTGALVHTLDNPNAYDTSASDWFGYSVAISGGYAIVGAYQEDDAGGSESGKAYIYDVTTGELLLTIDNPNAYDTSAGDRFAKSVAISGNYVIVGAEREDDASGTWSGKSYIFELRSSDFAYKVVADPAPKLGGNLDTNGFNINGLLYPTADGANGQVLTTDGSGTLSFTNPAITYTDSDVDAHLNTSTATTNQVLSWNGSDYAWSTAAAGGLNSVVEDATPQLGGDLDAQFNNIINVQNLVLEANTTTSNTAVFSWNDIDGTVDLAYSNGVALQLGQEEHVYAKANEAISDGDVVMFAGAQGDHILIAKADVSSATFKSEYIIGVATQDFLANDFGYVTTFGKVRGLNLDPANYADGQILYADPGVVGGLTADVPAYPYPIVQVAAILRAHQTEGTLMVRPIIMSHNDIYGDFHLYQSTETLTVTVDTKDATHPQFNNGSTSGFKINGTFSPFLHMVPGMTYRFDQSDSTNVTHPIAFYYDEQKNTAYTSGVTNNGTAGSTGAYTEITVSADTPSVLYYQCSNHDLMGWGINISTHNLTGFDTDDLSEGNGNLYYTTARFNTDFGNKSTTDLTEGNNLYHTTARARVAISGTGDITYDSGTGVISFNNNSGYLTSETYSTASELLTAIKTVDGTTSGLDADLLDGEQGSHYLDYANFTSKPTSILDFGITDGTAGQVLQTDGSGNFSFTTPASGGGGVGAGYAGYEDYFFNVASSTTTFGTASATHDKVQVFVNGVFLDDSDFTFAESTGIVTLNTPAENGDVVSIWGYNSTNLDNHELFAVDTSGNVALTGTLQIGNHRKEGSLTSTIATTSATNVVMYTSADYVGSKLIITVTDTVTGDTQITEALILTVNGGTPKVTTYGTMFTSTNALASFDVANVSTNTALEVTMASTNSSTVKVAYTLIDA